MGDNMYSIAQLEGRYSVRSYSSEPLDSKILNALRAEATMVSTHEAGLRLVVCDNDSSPFDGFSRSYGMFKGVNNYLVAVIDESYDHARERAGFYSQQFVMKAYSLGVGTCFVGGTFSASHVAVPLKVFEKIPFVIPFGIEEGKTTLFGRLAMKVAHRKKMVPRDFFAGSESEYQEALKKLPWLPLALQAVACAPSSLNKRPVRLALNEAGELTASTMEVPDIEVDLGIAKFNVSAVIPGVWNWGEGASFTRIKPSINPTTDEKAHISTRYYPVRPRHAATLRGCK